MKRLYNAGSTAFSIVAAITLVLGILASSGPTFADTPPSGGSYTGKCSTCPPSLNCSGVGKTCDDRNDVPCANCMCTKNAPGGPDVCKF